MLRQYEAGDINKIKLQPEQELERNDNWSNFASISSLVYTDNEKVLAIIRPLEEYGRISLYALVGRDCGYKGISIVKSVKKWIKEQLLRPDVNRIDITTQSDFNNANRLAELLGFTYEGTMHNFFKGIDFNMWGIWK